MKIELSDGERLDRINENLVIIQRKHGLAFGTDSYLLAAFAKKMTREAAADFGSGTGVASLLCAARGKYKIIYALEIQREFFKLSKRNAAVNGLDGVISSVCCDIRNAKSYIAQGSLGAVISNPPYMPKMSGAESSHDEMNTARREENGTVADFCMSAAALLRHGGIFTVVYRPERLAELFFALKGSSLEPKRLVFVYPDEKSPPCLVLVESKKGAAPSLRVARPLIIYSEPGRKKDRRYTEDMDRVYDEFSLDFLF